MAELNGKYDENKVGIRNMKEGINNLETKIGVRY